MTETKLSQSIPLEYKRAEIKIPNPVPKNSIISYTRGCKMGFVAGPYIGDGTYNTVENNIREAEIVAIELANRGIFFFCPHTHTRHFQLKAKAPESFYKELNFWHLLSCHFLVATPRWHESSGARNEVEECVRNHKPIFILNSVYDKRIYNLIENFTKS